MHKRRVLALSIAIIYTFFLLYFSLANVEAYMPETGISYQDKLFHLFAYIVLAVLWTNTLVLFAICKPIIVSLVFTLIFGIVLELVQEKLNPERTYDTMDLLSNCIGVVIGTIIVAVKSKKLKLK